jgi:Ca-activated chloride channel family protein
MTFAWPHMLWLLAAPIALLARDCARRLRTEAGLRPKILRAEAGAHSVSLEAGPGAAGRRSPRGWLCAGLVLSIVALARPQWGFIDQPVFEQAREIVIALDLSRSMETPDVKPNRLERAKLLIESLLDRLKGERVGLVVFSGTAFLQSPLSADYEILREFLPSLNPGYMPEGGTDYGRLIDTAAGAFSTGGGADRFLVILSDGGATDDGWRSHVSELTDRGIRVIGLGIGTPGGGFIPDGSGGYVKDENGAVVLSRLDSGTLRELASKTRGAYRDAAEWVDLAGLLHDTIEAGRKGKFTEKDTERLIERYQWALAPALLCLLLSFWLEFPVRPKPREVRLTARGPEPAPSVAAAAAAILILAGLAARLSAQTDAQDAPVDATPLSHIVGRLSGEDHPTARDWGELSRETVSWGQRVHDAQQPVPAGPIRDGLAAVDAGSALDSRAEDWPKLRSELQVLLQKPPEQKPPPQQQSQNRQNQQQQQQQQQQNQRNSSSQQRQNEDSSRPQDQNAPGQPRSQPQNESALGPMNSPNPPQPRDDGTQQVGGAPERPKRDPSTSDPQVEASIEKLDQIRDQDSPAELYQMIEKNEPHPPAPKPAKDW